MREDVAKASRHHASRRVVSAVDEDRSEHRFERVGENRRAVGSAALVLALTEPDLAAETEAPRDAGERVLVHERGAHPGQVAFGKGGEALVERGADDAVQHGVADELEALVMRGAVAAVREGAAKQVGVAKGVVEPLAKRFGHRARHPRQREADALNSMSRLTL